MFECVRSKTPLLVDPSALGVHQGITILEPLFTGGWFKMPVARCADFVFLRDSLGIAITRVAHGFEVEPARLTVVIRKAWRFCRFRQLNGLAINRVTRH